MTCGVMPGNTYTFGDQSGVSVQVVTAANLACLYVDEMALNHPNATPGIQSGQYWLIRSLQSDKQTNATGFSVNLTLPTTFTPDDNDKLCRYPGNLSSSGWDCAANSYRQYHHPQRRERLFRPGGRKQRRADCGQTHQLSGKFFPLPPRLAVACRSGNCHLLHQKAPGEAVVARFCPERSITMKDHQPETKTYLPTLIVLEIELETRAGSSLKLSELVEPAE